ncbi:TetR/AcrR family transcriptional regulator [Nocardia huaxiensis]|uniref:TetR/AcrR family transcriptional regulator n=1 Tax=Nocardia huaxiensis TaxID=2755382 RepID=A0A7D6ZDP3_9NOCA|nr:TetR/AcrR family transcriptional regulator [Nocardia huaxiensis]QLY33068.1 TetR/AcrR family transcriptional regulator [Nocardia huaxiensis]UFS93167.1 TetR/AcrR family transcriptional regulator [Nocardia huaxiensis]
MTIEGRQYGGRAVVERKAERRQRFLDAAILIFGERGYANCSLADVCAAAGLSKRQFYEEFQTREDILVAAYDHIQEQAGAALATALSELGPDPVPTDTVTTALSAYLGSVGSDPNRAKVAFVEVVGVSERMEQHRRERRHSWIAIITAAVDPLAGPGAHVRGNAELGVSALIGAINGLAHEWLLSDPRPPVRELVDVLVPIALSLIVRD